ncbi:hypothetical protein KUTeg_000168 [Tegillarca granosa]|uniref:Solute carrier organic anion transporter family member n=1 Tax=Tegillarca granosa TaxID=220873 RepID=A0ABQ9FWR8_TEGGR|nr:hypothetical protein KUTeg_000168 [Tegillarca granosa]
MTDINNTETEIVTRRVSNTADRETNCGIGSCQPEGLQCCANILPFSLLHGVTLLLTQAFSLYIASQITTIEKAYNLNSTTSGILLSCNDIGFVVTVLLVSHFGRRHHIPRILGVSVIIYAIAGILSSLPQFISWKNVAIGSSSRSNSNVTIDTNLCNIATNGTTNLSGNCTTSAKSEQEVKWVVVWFGVCFAVQGLAKSPRNPLGTLYVDSNVDKTKTGFYIGIISTIGLFGPFIGLILGGMFATIPVDLKETFLTPYDPRWIGAWWIGFLVIGGLALICSIPVFCFPKYIKQEEQTENETKMARMSDTKESVCREFKDLPKSMFRILRKPVFSLTLLSIICIMLSIVAVNGFGPKYIETQFNRPVYEANITLGIQRIITSAIGTFLGGVITRKLKLDRKGCLKMIVILHLVECIFHSLQFLFGCENEIIYGQEIFHQLYLVHVSLRRTWRFVIKVEKPTTHPVLQDVRMTVQEDDRAMAMGIVSFSMSLFAFIPGPILFGMLIDSTCRIWNSTCGVRGACSLYNITDMRMKLISADVVLNIISFALNVLTLICVTIETRKMLTSDTTDKK